MKHNNSEENSEETAKNTVAPHCGIGELVDVRTHKPKNYDREFIIEIRRLRGSGKFFAHVEAPNGLWYVINWSRETQQKAYNSGKKMLDFFDEDVKLEEEDYDA